MRRLALVISALVSYLLLSTASASAHNLTCRQGSLEAARIAVEFEAQRESQLASVRRSGARSDQAVPPATSGRARPRRLPARSRLPRQDPGNGLWLELDACPGAALAPGNRGRVCRSAAHVEALRVAWADQRLPALGSGAPPSAT